MNSNNLRIISKEAKIIEIPNQYCEICQKRDTLLHSITELFPKVIYFVELICINLNEEKIRIFVIFSLLIWRQKLNEN